MRVFPSITFSLFPFLQCTFPLLTSLLFFFFQCILFLHLPYTFSSTLVLPFSSHHTFSSTFVLPYQSRLPILPLLLLLSTFCSFLEATVVLHQSISINHKGHYALIMQALSHAPYTSPSPLKCKGNHRSIVHHGMLLYSPLSHPPQYPILFPLPLPLPLSLLLALSFPLFASKINGPQNTNKSFKSKMSQVLRDELNQYSMKSVATLRSTFWYCCCVSFHPLHSLIPSPASFSTRFRSTQRPSLPSIPSFPPRFSFTLHTSCSPSSIIPRRGAVRFPPCSCPNHSCPYIAFSLHILAYSPPISVSWDTSFISTASFTLPFPALYCWFLIPAS